MSIGSYIDRVILAVSGKEPKAPTNVIGWPAESYCDYKKPEGYGLGMIDDLVRDKGLAPYREMFDRDEQVSACCSLPVLSVVARGWTLADPTAEEEKEPHAFATHALNDLDESSVSRLCTDSMEALWMCFAVIERIMREPYESLTVEDYTWTGKQGIRTFRTMPQETVTFKRDEHGDIEPDGVWQAKPPNSAPGLAPEYFNKFPRKRFVLWKWQHRWGNPLGMSILRPAYRWFYGKDRMLKSWLRYMERYGHPIAVLPVDKTAGTGAKTAAEAVLKDLMLSHMAVSPSGLIPTIVPNPQHAGSVDAYVKFFEVANKSIAKCCLLPPTVLDVGDGGSFALAASQWKGPFMSYLDNLDRTWTDEVMQEQVLRPLIRHNFGADAVVPQFTFNEWSKGDLSALATVFQVLHTIGYPLSKQDIAKTFGREIAEDEEDMLPKAPAAPPPGLPGAESPFNPFGETQEDTIREGEQLDALAMQMQRDLAEDLLQASQDPSGDDHIDVLKGNGEKSKQYARNQWDGVLERGR
jgi:hypothetical protein